MPRPKRLSPEDHAQTQRLGNVDPKTIQAEDILERDLADAHRVAMAHVRAIVTNPDSAPAAKVAAFKALNATLMDLRADKRANPRKPAKERPTGSSIDSLVELLRQFGEPASRQAFERAFARPQHAVKAVDLAQLGEL